MGPQGQGFGWWWDGHPMGLMWGAWGIGMMLMMLIFWIVVIALLVYGIRWFAGLHRPHRDPALDILRQRYARGEISQEEFEEKKRALT